MKAKQIQRIALLPASLVAITGCQAEPTPDSVTLFFAAIAASVLCIVVAAKREREADGRQ